MTPHSTRPCAGMLRPLLACLLMFSGFTSSAFARSDYLDLSLEELLDAPINVASRSALSQRESPGILTVVHGDEIRRSGARNLEDVLRQVPGFDFRLISTNVLGLGMRGHIGSDGRVLLQIDGIEVNEHRFGTAQFGQGFPMASIKRIEILRGSAMAMYGGSAELGVINIITRDANDLDGGEVAVGAGYAGNARSSEYVGLMAGQTIGGVALSASLHDGRAQRSDGIFYGQGGASYDMSATDEIYPRYANLALSAGGFSMRYLRDASSLDSRFAVGTIQPAAWKIGQDAESLQLQYSAQPAEHVTLLSSLLYQEQTPRETTDHLGVLQSRTEVRRTQAKLGVVWDAQDDWDVAGGVEYLDEHYKGVVRTFPLGRLAYTQLGVASVYGEVSKRSEWGDFIVGARRDDHDYAGVVWSERLGYTRIMGPWHAKVMASHAERAPSVEDYSASTSTQRKNETVRTLELEAGYRMDADTQLTLDLFDIETRDTLILLNRQSVRTRGLEATYQIRKSWGDASLSYSYYRAFHTTTAVVQPVDATAGNLVVDDEAHLAFANHKLVARCSYQFTDALSINPALVYSGPRWGYDVPQIAPGVGTLREFPSTTQLDVTLFWKNAGMQGLDLSLGVFNALDESAVFLLPFNSTTPPLPDLGREYVLNAYFAF
ncbi:TonB-dependent siderophore receptor [Thiobacillus sp.]|uniref:TonB-dependent receptor plug domain-containing protein n=1 Tax=Thiobacillus sp. TaxID=924 RepID=UPI0025E7CD5E|nr:TonB-dependent receptor [Thiobacillus sp.]MBT9538401.1 TonB-dependent receptor [Thiobacillus sp.]